MITRAQIIRDLDELVLRLANEMPAPKPSEPGRSLDDVLDREAGWAYAKGLASHAILQLRDSLIAVGK